MYYKAPNNTLHAIDPEHANLLPPGSIAITDAEAAAMQAAANPPPNPKVVIQGQIDALEAQQLLPRITREFMLVQFAAVAAQQGVNPMTNFAFAKLKAFDDQIAALRAQLA
jgi:hypothetical protein